MCIKIIAHRGLGPTSQFTGSKFGQLPVNLEPENSLAAFEQALIQGANGLECDICPSKDGYAMVIHNDRLNKNVYQADRDEIDLGFIHQLTRDEIQKEINNQYTFPLGHQQKIPTLQDLLALVVKYNQIRKQQQKPNVIVNVELKQNGAAEAAFKAVAEYISKGLIESDSIVYCSFETEFLEDIRKCDRDSEHQSLITYILKTDFLYGKYKIIPPNWFVPFQYAYQDYVINELQKIHDSLKLYGIDAEYWDVEPQLIEFVINNDITLHNWPSDKEPRVINEGIVHNVVQLNKQIKDIYFKVDSPLNAVTYFDKVQKLYAQFALKNVDINHYKILNSLPTNAFKYLPNDISKYTDVQLVEIQATEQQRPIVVVAVMDKTLVDTVLAQQNTIQELSTHLIALLYLDDELCIKPEVLLNILRFYSKRFVGKAISV